VAQYPEKCFKSCDIGTAFGYVRKPSGLNNINLNTLPPKNCNSRWGWYFTPTKDQLLATVGISGDLFVGAGGNDIMKAIDVGDFKATLSTTPAGLELTVTYTLDSGFDLGEVHVYAACTAPKSCAPGSFTYPATQPNLSGTSDTSFVAKFIVPSCTSYYIVIHAKVNQRIPILDPCPATMA